MISRCIIGLPAAVLGMALLAPSAPAQGRGMRSAPAGAHGRSSPRLGGRGENGRRSQRGFLDNSSSLYPPYFFPYDDDYDYDDEPDTPEASPVPQAAPVQIVVAQAAPTPAPVAAPVEPLLLENHGGQWVRIPTGNQMAISHSAKPDAAQASSLQTAISSPNESPIESPAEAAPPQPELPPAIVVFRDGHMEEVGKYMIQGDALFTNTDDWSTGSWTRKIPLADLDIPASLKLNKERGSKFSLPSGPNDVVIRF